MTAAFASARADEDLLDLVATVWQDVNPDVPVSPRSDLFADLGATGFAAELVTDRVREASGRDAPLQLAYERSRLAEYVDALAASPAIDGAGARGRPLLGLRSRVGEIRPSTYTARGAVQWPEGRSPVNVLFIARIDGPLDVAVLRRAMAHIVARHETLRSGFDRAGYQLVFETCRVEIPETACPPDAFDDLCAELLTEPFTLAEPPLWRLRLVRSGEQLHLVAVFNHVICDGGSVGVFVRELALLYRAESGDASVSLEPAVQYGDFATYEQGIEAVELEWWRSALDVTPPHWRPLPTSGPLYSQVAAVRFDGDGPGPLPSTPELTPPTLVRAAIVAALIDDLPDGELVLQSVQSRRGPHTRTIIGWLSDHLPIPVRVERGATAAQLCARIADATREARRRWPQSESPILTDVARVLGRPPESLVHVEVNYMTTSPSLGWEQAGPRTRFVPLPIRRTWAPELLPGPTTGCALRYHLQVDRTSRRLTDIETEGPSDVFTVEQLHAKAQQLATTIEAMVHDPDWRL